MKSSQKKIPVSKRVRGKRSKAILTKSEGIILFPEKQKMAEEILKKFPVPEKLLNIK